MIEKSPLRYVLPNAMTLARPFLTREVVKAKRKGEKKKALAWLLVAWATDADGTVARRLDATSYIGKILDPIADQAMKVQIFSELEMAEGTKTITAVFEAAIVVTNTALFGLSKITKGRIMEPSATSLGKLRFSIDAFGAARLVQKPKDKFASWLIAGTSVLSFIDYAHVASQSIKERKQY